MDNKTKHMHLIPLNCLAKAVLVLLICGLMTACGKKENVEKPSQSIVSVNGDEITFLQLNNELQHANIKPEQQGLAEKQIVQKLVDRQILVQESLKAKLDRDSRVMQAIENAKMQILAQAYLESKVATLTKPTEAEIVDYYANHADIFANRKVYVMDQLVFAVNTNNAHELEALSDNAKTIEEVTKWLNEHQITYAQAKEAHLAESLPSELLAKISKMNIGDLIFFKTNSRILVSRMVDIQNKPISEGDSRPIIERILLSQKRKQVAETEISRLRSVAKIDYINKKFEPSSNNSNPETPKPPGPDKQDTLTEPSAPATVLKPTDNGKTAEHIEKGLSGL